MGGKFSRVICNDKQEYLIELYKAVQKGWVPPDSLPEEEYRYIRAHKDDDKALTAFAGFGCSFGGKWFGGYGRHSRASAENTLRIQSKRALMRDIGILRDAEFLCLDYREAPLPDGCVIYADPPYRGRMQAYGLKEQFDSDAFWEWAKETSAGHDVYVSELEAPEGFQCIWEKPVTRRLGNCSDSRFKAIEKLFVYRKD